MKQAGLNVLDTYVEWSLHNPKDGVYDFNGMANVTHFLDIAVAEDFLVILRPGPYICAERDNVIDTRKIFCKKYYSGILQMTSRSCQLLVHLVFLQEFFFVKLNSSYKNTKCPRSCQLREVIYFYCHDQIPIHNSLKGGLPYWLFTKYTDIKLRTMDANYLREVEIWYAKLMPMLVPYMYENGGPIIMVQV